MDAGIMGCPEQSMTAVSGSAVIGPKNNPCSEVNHTAFKNARCNAASNGPPMKMAVRAGRS